MTIVRDISTYRLLQYNMVKTSTSLNKLYIKSATGLEVAKASDNPTAVPAIIGSRSSISASDRYITNCQSVQEHLSSAETYIDSVLDIMDRAKEIAVSAANDSLSDDDLATYLDEVGQLQEGLLDLANAQVEGRYIFAGYDDLAQPFSGSPVSYSGSADHRMISVSPDATVADNITGEELFTCPIDLFATLDDLATALGSGDTASISRQLTPLEKAAQQVRTQQSRLGNTMNRLDDLISLHTRFQLLTTEKLSTQEDADLSEVLSDVSRMELSLEATMEVASRVSSLSLFDSL